MPENDFLTFAGDPSANVITQGTYAGSSVQEDGFVSGIAPSATVNKPIRQAALIAAMIADFVVTVGNLPMVDGGTASLPTLLANFIASLQALGRAKLAANANLYVATTGSDTTGNGTSGAPWATLQKAWSYIIGSVDLNGFNVTVNVANGTYTAGVSAQGTPVGDTQDGGGVLFLGNPGSPASVIILVTGGTSCFEATNDAQFSVNGFTVQASGSAYAVSASGASNIGVVGPMIFGACAAGGIASGPFSTIVVSANYTINGSQGAHWNASQGIIVITPGVTITVTGTPAFSTSFANANLLGIINCFGLTFTGSATGQRYNATQNSIINTSGGGASYLPGDSAGATSSGGLYV
jgi:hypothetical protein